MDQIRGKKIRVSEAATILGCKDGGIYQYINKGKLSRTEKDGSPYVYVYLEEVENLRQMRAERKRSAKQGQRAYTGGPGCPFDIRVILDPDDDSGLIHEWFISKQAFDDLHTGVRQWGQIPASEIYFERVSGRLPLPKRKD